MSIFDTSHRRRKAITGRAILAGFVAASIITVGRGLFIMLGLGVVRADIWHSVPAPGFVACVILACLLDIIAGIFRHADL